MPIHFVEDEAAQEEDEKAQEEAVPFEQAALQEHLAGVVWNRDRVARCRKVPGSITGVGLGCIGVPAMLQLLIQVVIRCGNKPCSQ